MSYGRAWHSRSGCTLSHYLQSASRQISLQAPHRNTRRDPVTKCELSLLSASKRCLGHDVFSRDCTASANAVNHDNR
jgi:hypothetical protein